MDIPNIGIRNIDVDDVSVPNWMLTPPTISPYAPVTTQVGVPIIDIPGCVESHLDNDKGTNDNLVGDDPKGARVFCDGNMPSFSPLDFTPENMTITKPTAIPKVPPPPEPPVPETPELPKPPVQTVVVEEQPEPEPEIPWVDKYLPAPEAATTTAAIAVVATTSALLAKPLADILLKVIKPAIKKVLTKISKLRGKKIAVLSSGERRAEQRQRNHAIRDLRSVLPRKKG